MQATKYRIISISFPNLNDAFITLINMQYLFRSLQKRKFAMITVEYQYKAVNKNLRAGWLGT